ncbi:MAG: ribonuclease Z [Ruminococcaceae bacterium]|nr:ribonuclease Z [Oscillospiraceae bacterium]
MKVIVCLDDKRGMFFNERRQSRDRVLNADVVAMSKGSRLFIDPYSKMLFEDSGADIVCDADFLELAGDGDLCFVENRALSGYIDKLEEIIIYRWNRSYPTDIFFDLEPEEHGFKCVSVSEFQGSSHDKITKEIFTK